MKRLLLIVLAVGIVSCVPDLREDHVCMEKVHVDVKTKALLPEDVVGNINIYAYHDGVLYSDGYFSGQNICLELNGGLDYTIYALANVGEVPAPLQESELNNVRCGFPDPSLMPMCCREGVSVNFSGDGSIDLTLTRLLAKISLRLENRLSQCSLDIESVQLMQTPSEMQPFVQGSKITGGVDGQAASAEQLEKLKNGEYIDLYMLENCQGVLLPDNDLPQKKNPWNIADKAQACSYLHIRGQWSTYGAEADSDVRFYLGRDACSDFNVVRNTNIVISLLLTDNGIASNGWKAELSNLDDVRAVTATSDYFNIYYCDDWVKAPVEIAPSNLTVFATVYGSEGNISEDVECEVRNGEVYLRAIDKGPYFSKKSAILHVCTWDYLQVVRVNVRLFYKPGEFDAYDAYIPSAVGEWGYLRFTGDFYTPISLYFGDSDTRWVFVNNSGMIYDAEYVNAGCGYEVYAPEDSNIIYIHRTGEGKSDSWLLEQGGVTADITVPESSNPGYVVTDGCFTEAGCLLKDGGFYYDSDIIVDVVGSDGGKIPMTNFRTPDWVLQKRSEDVTVENAYRAFEEQFGVLSYRFIHPEFYFMTHVDGSLHANYENGHLCHLRIYGIGTVPPDISSSFDIGFEMKGWEGASNIKFRPTFPSQRDLGNVENYSVAPYPMRSMNAHVDFSGNGEYLKPVENLVKWKLGHVRDSYAKIDNAMFYSHSDTTSKYVSNVSMDGDGLVFGPVSETVYPSSGAMALRGTVINPHTNAKIEGFYRLDLVLYLPLICSFSYAGTASNSTLKISVVPFYETQYPQMWTQVLPTGITASPDHLNYAGTVNKFTVCKSFTTKTAYPRKTTLLEALQVFSSDRDNLFTFTLNAGAKRGLSEYTYDRAGFAGTTYSTGVQGYYRVVRQYDEKTILENATHYGLDNYLLNAALNKLTL